MAGGGTQVDDVGAFNAQLAGVRDRSRGVEVAAAVGERVLGDVDDPDEDYLQEAAGRAAWFREAGCSCACSCKRG